MKTRSLDAVWMSAAFGAALLVAIAMLVAHGSGERGIGAALAATARVHFLLFWLAYSGGPLTFLFGRVFQPLKRHAREFGLAFASALLVHLGLVVVLCLMDAAPPVPIFVFFGIAAAFAYILALLSIPRFHQALPSSLWWVLSNVGLNYIAYAYLVDFLKEPFSGGIRHLIEYLPFAALAVAGPVLRVISYAKHAKEWWLRSAAEFIHKGANLIRWDFNKKAPDMQSE